MWFFALGAMWFVFCEFRNSIRKDWEGFNIKYLLGGLAFSLFYLFVFQYPEAVPQGIFTEFADVKCEDQHENLKVDFLIEEDYDENGTFYYYYPQVIYWPNGGYTYLNRDNVDAATSIGDYAYAYSDEDEREYVIEIPEIHYSTMDKLLAIDKKDLFLFGITLIFGFISLIVYFVGHNESSNIDKEK